MKRQNIINETKKHIENIKPIKLLLLIIIFALLLRLYFFMGFINAHDLDEGIYIAILNGIYKGTYNLDRYKSIPNSYIPDTAETFQFRIAFIFPIAALFFLFGVKDFIATLYPLICSLGGIIVAYYMGKLLFDEKVGLLAAFLLSFYPLDVMFATRIMSDVVLGFFMSLSVFFFLKAERRKTIKKSQKSFLNDYYMICGIIFGIAYRVKPVALILVPFFLIYIIFKRKFDFKYIHILYGFLIIFFIGALYYFIETGNPMLDWEIANRAVVYSKYGGPYVESKKFLDDKIIISYVDSPSLLFLKSVFYIFRRFPGVNFFGYFFYFVFPVIILLFLLKKKDTYFLLAWFLFILLYIEFGPIGIKFDAKNYSVNYLAFMKKERYLNIETVPMILILSYSFLKIRKEFLLLILCFLVLTSIYCIYKGQEYFLSGMYSIKKASAYLNLFPRTYVYTDYVAAGMIQYYSGFQRNDKIRNFNDYNITSIKNAFVVVGGSRGVELTGTFVEESYNRTMSNYDENWETVEVIPNPFKKYDISHLARDLTIFYVK
jgi:hypothetical protein